MNSTVKNCIRTQYLREVQMDSKPRKASNS